MRAENELHELLDVAARSPGSRLRRKSDEYGYEWIVIEDPDFEDLVTTVHLVGSELKARGFGPQLLASIFRFEGARAPGLLDLRLQARRVLAVRADGRAASATTPRSWS